MSVFRIEFQKKEEKIIKMMRPVTNREMYLRLRGSERQKAALMAVRNGNEDQKRNLVQMVYSCLPNEDGTLAGSTRMSTCVGMDIDHIPAEEMQGLKERILQKKDELGLLMLELSARGAGYHLVFKRHADLTQEENLHWASDLLDVKFDEGAKDITRVFYTTTADEDNLIYLDDEIFDPSPCSPEGESRKVECPEENNTPLKGEMEGASFKGIPYTSIISEYWRQTGGEPSEGERNVKLHKLAVNLRSICDNKKEVLMQVMPRYGLSEAELKSIVDSACKEQPKGISKVMQSIIDNSLLPREETEEGSDTPIKLDVKSLPIGLKESLIGVPENMQMPVLCGIMPLAAAYADGVEVRYCDLKRQHLGLMTIVRGPQASNKSVVKDAIESWRRQFAEEDKIARQREDEWKEQRKARKANEKAPEDPHVVIRMVPVTISCSTLLKRLKNADGHTLYSFSEELDTLIKTNGAGSWSSKYDVYRYSFDKAEWGQDYNSDAAESGVVNVAYNWTMLGTNAVVRKCFKHDNIENGLSSRVLVSEMPDASFAKMPKFRERSEKEEARIQQAVTMLRSASGFVKTSLLNKAIEEWVEAKRVQAEKDADQVMDTLRKRSAVIGFRCGVVFHLLTGKKKESKACLDFAVTMAEYCLRQQIKIFGEALRNQYINAQDECQKYGCNHSVFDQLAPTFTMNDLRTLKQGLCGEAALRKAISRWCKDEWIEKVDKTHWKKLSVA